MFRFSFLGFPVQIHWLFWVTCVILGGGFSAASAQDWIRIAVWTSVVFLSIMVHELGHAVAARQFGGRPAIVLHGLGGLTVMPGLKLNRTQSILLSLAGPAAGIFLGGVILAISPLLIAQGGPLAKTVVGYLLLVNIFWSLFNLLPVLPMDGGQISRDLLGPKRIGMARMIGGATSSGLCVLALLAGLWILSIFLGVLAYSNFRQTTVIEVQGGVVK